MREIWLGLIDVHGHEVEGGGYARVPFDPCLEPEHICAPRTTWPTATDTWGKIKSLGVFRSERGEFLRGGNFTDPKMVMSGDTASMTYDETLQALRDIDDYHGV